ncbi:hypothetical protein Hanom_Chr09g00787381 [Helianthus anomalus]
MFVADDTGNVEKAGGDERVEGVVQTDSSETESDNQILTSTADPMENWRKKKDKPTKKRKDSDEDDASYVPIAAELEKSKKGRGRRKRMSQRESESPQAKKARKGPGRGIQVTIGGERVQRMTERVETSVVETSTVVSTEIPVPAPPRSHV